MKLKKTLVMVLAACLLIGTLAGTAMADVENNGYVKDEKAWNWIGWFTEEQFFTSPEMIPGEQFGVVKDATTGTVVYKLYYKDTPYSGWKYLGNYWFYFKNGEVQRHWQNIGGEWYYFLSNGVMVQNGTAWIENKLYIFDEDGTCVTTPGWYAFDHYFYVYENDEANVYYPTMDYAIFYLNENGFIQTGWNKIGSDWYMVDKYSGRVLSNEWYQGEGGYWYYFDTDGAMVTGWQTISSPFTTDRTYYFNEAGVCQWGWLFKDNNWYYLSDYNAARYENAWVKIGNPRDGYYWYLFDENGIMQTGWQAVKTGNKILVREDPDPQDPTKTKKVFADEIYWYYLTPWGGMVTGEQFLNGEVYTFSDVQDGTLGALLQKDNYGVLRVASSYLEPKTTANPETDQAPKRIVDTKVQ